MIETAAPKTDQSKPDDKHAAVGCARTREVPRTGDCWTLVVVLAIAVAGMSRCQCGAVNCRHMCRIGSVADRRQALRTTAA